MTELLGGENISTLLAFYIINTEREESPADAGIPARRKTMKKIPPFRSYNKFQSSRKSGVYSN